VEAFDVMEKSVEALAAKCEQLEKRLNTVLRQEPEMAASAQSEVPRTVVVIAQRLNSNSDRVHALNNQLNSILRRLEI
jgi:phage shock protein A